MVVKSALPQSDFRDISGPLNVVLLGPPGAGKGTQAERLARDRDVPKISIGDLLRAAVRSGSELGRRSQDFMNRGELVSDDVIIEIVRDRLHQPDMAYGFVLDGFPRTEAQAEALDGVIGGRSSLIVVDIMVPEEELVRRLAARRVCERCGVNADELSSPIDLQQCRHCGGRLTQRSDDRSEVVRDRLKVYRVNAQPLLEHYQNRGTLVRIDGAQAPEQVAADLARSVDEARSAKVWQR